MAEIEKAIFAGGCFWCMEHAFEKLAGVQSVRSGYTCGTTENPTYKEVSSGKTGHIEAVEILFDSKLTSYESLLKVFWKNIDPFDGSGQFCDKGEQYRSGIFYLNDQQQELARKSLQKHQNSQRFKGKKIFTLIRPACDFYQAEDYHQDYFKKNPLRYKFYRYQCGRDKRLDEIWNLSVK